jgi:hypothetical protein
MGGSLNIEIDAKVAKIERKAKAGKVDTNKGKYEETTIR